MNDDIRLGLGRSDRHTRKLEIEMSITQSNYTKIMITYFEKHTSYGNGISDIVQICKIFTLIRNICNFVRMFVGLSGYGLFRSALNVSIRSFFGPQIVPKTFLTPSYATDCYIEFKLYYFNLSLFYQISTAHPNRQN